MTPSPFLWMNQGSARSQVNLILKMFLFVWEMNRFCCKFFKINSFQDGVQIWQLHKMAKMAANIHKVVWKKVCTVHVFGEEKGILRYCPFIENESLDTISGVSAGF